MVKNNDTFKPHDHKYVNVGTGLQNLPLLFDLKIVYSYVIEVADFESDLILHGRSLISEMFYHLKNAQGRQDVVVIYTLVKFF